MLTYSFFKNKRVTVFGLGLNSGGVGTVHFLMKAGVREVIVTDIKKREELLPSFEKLKSYKNITYVLGQHRPEDFSHVDMVIKNPRLPWSNDYVKLALKNKIPVEMDSSIFFALCPAPIIGVTGSKGKTTTAVLIAHTLEKAGKKVVRIGMDRESVLGKLENVTPQSVVVFELSSWRLSALEHLGKSPSLAVLTNIYPDHLDYYRTLDAYIDDKKNIFRFQKKTESLIANGDDETVRTMAADAPSHISWYALQDHPDVSLFLDGDALLFRKDGNAEQILSLGEYPSLKFLFRENILAAILALLQYGLKPKEIAQALKSFTGVPHRLERVAEKNGVEYYNDTTATIPEAAIAALTLFQKPVVLLAGGSDKKLDFRNFAQAIAARPKRTIFFRGPGTEKILMALEEFLPQETIKKFSVVDSMAEAMTLAQSETAPGDIVLLSPGATSFGIFQNEFDRGDQFRARVQALPN